jgi:hypothetical protein
LSVGIARSGHQIARVSEETLRGWLSRLASPTVPGMWAVRWVQGGVAAGAQQANFFFRRKVAEAHLYGNFTVDARQLAEQFERGRIPKVESDRHWVVALDGLENFQGRLRLASRDKNNHRQIVIIEDGSIVKVEQDIPSGASANLSLILQPAERGRLTDTPWAAEVGQLSKRLTYCPIPVVIGRKPLSGRTAFSHNKDALMNWIEVALGNERHFLMQGDPRQILSPRLVATRGVMITPQRCSLMMTLSRVPPGQGWARAYWLRDGALTDPVRLAGATGCMRMDILCPGDRPGLELPDWHRCDPASLFPVALVLSVARRLAGGLDSMAQEAAAVDRPIDELLRRANTGHAWTRFLPTLGRPYNALGGTFHQALKAFSLRPSLELLQG